MKELKSYYHDELTNSQAAAVAMIESFLNSSDHYFILSGYAGTGKTYLIRGIAEYLIDRETEFKLMAPTGRAAQVITQKTSIISSTIHKSIYLVDKAMKITDSKDNEKARFVFQLKYNPMADSVFIIDEASMISDESSDSGYVRFGSGKLLADLIEWTNIEFNKLIFVGDPAQLPPVKSNESPALNQDYLYKTYSLHGNKFELTDVVRQVSDSEILDNATKLRNEIQKLSKSELNNNAMASNKHGQYGKYDSRNTFSIIQAKGNEIFSVPKYDFHKHYTSLYDTYGLDELVVIAYSNKTVKYYNDRIRKLFERKPEISIGDKVVVVNNNYSYSSDLYNGEIGEILDLDDYVESRIVNFPSESLHNPSMTNVSHSAADILPQTDEGKVIINNYDRLNDISDGEGKLMSVLLEFRNVRIKFKAIDGNDKIVNCKIYEPLLYNSERDITIFESRALWFDFRLRFAQENLSSKDLMTVMSIDPYYNCLRIKFGYALTCHKAQGGEWDNVFIDYFNPFIKNYEEYYRWEYTALTRARKQVYLIEPQASTEKESQKAATKNESDLFLDNNAKTGYVQYEQGLPPFNPNIKLPKDLADKPQIIKNIYHAVSGLIDLKQFKLSEIKHFPACERYFFTKNRETAWYNIWFTKSGKISLVDSPVGADSPMKNFIKSKLVNLIGKNLGEYHL